MAQSPNYWTERRRARIESGECMDCGKFAKANGARCERCRTRHAAKMLEWARRKRAALSMPQEERENPMRNIADIRRAIDALPYIDRVKVDAAVDRHLDACRRLGVKVESLDRVWVEALEALRLGDLDDIDAPQAPMVPSWQYPQYVSPREGCF